MEERCIKNWFTSKIVEKINNYLISILHSLNLNSYHLLIIRL